MTMEQEVFVRILLETILRDQHITCIDAREYITKKIGLFGVRYLEEALIVLEQKLPERK